jgi:endonuclease YncB( thermonuclease family)
MTPYRIATGCLLLFLASVLSSCVPPARKRVELGSGMQQSGARETTENNQAPKGTPSRSPGAATQDPKEIVLVPKELSGRVVGVHDGDTITVIDATNRQYKIRLSGIDAPELGQDFGRRSKENLSDLVFGKEVTIIHDKVDRYGRVVGKVLTEGRDANLLQVEAGLAWHFKTYEKEQSAEDRSSYASAETAARGARKGLWAQPNAVPPWDYRASKRR